MLKQFLDPILTEAGCDEAGRGCLAGPVFAAAVILPKDYINNRLNDSKQVSAKMREELRREIKKDALAWAIASCSNEEIDEMNILRASVKAMHRAVEQLSLSPALLLIDGNRFYPYKNIPYKTIVHGDATYLSIAAASILAKTARDEFMDQIDKDYPDYMWYKNKGYPTKEHRQAIRKCGPTPWHRMTFTLLDSQQELNFL